MTEPVLYDAIIWDYGTSVHISAQCNVDRPRGHAWGDASASACLRYMDEHIIPSYYGRPGQARRVSYRRQGQVL